MNPELFAQIATAIGGPGAVAFLWFMSRPRSSEGKSDPASGILKELRDHRDILIRIETLLETQKK